MNVIDGRALAEAIKDKVAAEIHGFSGPRPGLAIILVGERPDSKLYVSMKEKQAKTVGIDTHLYVCDDDISEEELIKTIEFLNNDEAIDAILVQLPLPKQINTDKVVNTIRQDKDIDGFTKKNRDLLFQASDNSFMPPVYGVIFSMLSSINFDINGKQAALIVNSDIFEDNLIEILKKQGAEVINDMSKADLVITAVGKAHSLTADMVKDDAVIIDIGISQDTNGKVVGDVDAESMKDKSGFMSPVPGGVGPMTIAMAFWNTLLAFKKHHQLK